MSDYKLNGKTVDYYGPEMTERRDRFNNIINGINMVLMNNIPEVDPSIWENWEDKSPMTQECEIVETEDSEAKHPYFCETHLKASDDEYECEDYEGETEIYQWFAVGDNDAEYLKRHNQYVTYSNMLDTYFLAITHLGTSWDYVDSMVNDILGDN